MEDLERSLRSTEFTDSSSMDALVEQRFAKLRADRIAAQPADPVGISLTITQADISYALRRCKGNLKLTADFLGVRRSLLKRKVDLSPSLKRLMQHLQEENLDMAEAKLLEQVEEGHYPAVAFYLKTIGKDRGYTERVTNEHELGPNATRTAAALIEAMRAGVSGEDAPKKIEAVSEEEIYIDVGEYEVTDAEDG